MGGGGSGTTTPAASTTERRCLLWLSRPREFGVLPALSPPYSLDLECVDHISQLVRLD